MPNQTLYICARQMGRKNKVILHPSDENAFLHSKKIKENYVWYITTQVSANKFIEKNIFETYNDPASAEDAIAEIDPNAEKVYQPRLPPDDFNLPRV